MARFEFEFTNLRDAGPLALDEKLITLPDEHADLKDQRAAARAINLLFPQAELKVYSCTDLADGSTVRRTVKIDVAKGPQPT